MDMRCASPWNRLRIGGRTARIASALYAAAASVTVLGLVLPHVAQVA